MSDWFGKPRQSYGVSGLASNDTDMVFSITWTIMKYGKAFTATKWHLTSVEINENSRLSLTESVHMQ